MTTNTLRIQRSDFCPDNTYFTTGSVEPDLRIDSADGSATLTIYNGVGSRRSSWGAPEVTSTVALEADDLVSIHVGYHHKHGGGQFWRHYHLTTSGDGQRTWEQAPWRTLSDDERARVIDAARDHAPAWANPPGKLRSERRAPETRITYKLVRLVDDGHGAEVMVSVYDGQTRYEIGKRLTERAVDDHGGGYYSYPTADGVKTLLLRRALWPEGFHSVAMRLALIECEIGGTILVYGPKLASTYLTPLRIVETLETNAPVPVAP